MLNLGLARELAVTGLLGVSCFQASFPLSQRPQSSNKINVASTKSNRGP